MDNGLSDRQLTELRQVLERRREELAAQLDHSRAGSRPVDLDQPIGRLSRMEAIQQQQMTEATRRRSQQELIRIGVALEEVAAGEFGLCGSCGEPIAFARLKARPTSRMCRDCQDEREGGG